MELIYKYAESTVKPKAIDVTQSTIYLRKDIAEEKRTYTVDDTEMHTIYYTYQEAKLSPKEFSEYSSQIAAMNAVKGVNDSDNIEQIVENGVSSSDNQLIIMEAMADLYNLILDKM